MDGLVRVYAAADPIEGELRRGFLEAEEIPVVMKGGSESPYRLGPVYLFVPRSYEIKARVLLDAVAAGAFATGDDELESEGPPGRD